MKILAVVSGVIVGALIATNMILSEGYQFSEDIGVNGHEQPAYFTALILWPLYTLLGGITGGATVFAIMPDKRKEQLQPKGT